eukprot:GHVS01030629.1.p1 GENE.GHVS01030629.1~~GHVS01030629.1.p1  ORF type:complete len:698 (+),score=143.67 GHVS01030629.1:107-2200(+)
MLFVLCKLESSIMMLLLLSTAMLSVGAVDLRRYTTTRSPTTTSSSFITNTNNCSLCSAPTDGRGNLICRWNLKKELTTIQKQQLAFSLHANNCKLNNNNTSQNMSPISHSRLDNIIPQTSASINSRTSLLHSTTAAAAAGISTTKTNNTTDFAAPAEAFSVCSLASNKKTAADNTTYYPSPYIDGANGSYRRHWNFTRTKQIVTLGPATMTADKIEQLFLSGADVFRLNFSHGLHDEKAKMVELIRSVEDKYKHPIAILADLQGPKLRIGMFETEKTIIHLTVGQLFQLDMSTERGTSSRVNLPHPEILTSLKIGDTMLLDDGKLRVRVVECDQPGIVQTVVEVGGPLSSKKGVNIPTVVVPISALSEKDKRDALFAKTLGVDWVALSFVQRPEDMEEVRALLGDEISLIAKIERPAAVDRIDEILDASDGIMVARGDLGVEISPESVPIVQKQIVRKCRKAGKPVIVATQMLESMIHSPSPTRAEASDVATAIYEGADAVMLSGETAAGKYPVEAVRMQRRIIEIAEGDAATYWDEGNSTTAVGDGVTAVDPLTDSITRAARDVAEAVNAKALAMFTLKGLTVRRASKMRPKIPILAITPLVKEARKLQLVWGIFPVVDPGLFQMQSCYFEKMVGRACELARREGLMSSPEDYLVVTTGIPFGKHRGTNLLKVCTGRSCGAWTGAEHDHQQFEREQ